jgi:hypothetical protein
MRTSRRLAKAATVALRRIAARVVAPLFEQAMTELRDSDPTPFSARVRSSFTW